MPPIDAASYNNAVEITRPVIAGRFWEMRIRMLAAGVVLVLFGLAFVFPQVAHLNAHGNLPAGQVGLLMSGSAVTLGGLVSLMCGAGVARSGR